MATGGQGSEDSEVVKGDGGSLITVTEELKQAIPDLPIRAFIVCGKNESQGISKNSILDIIGDQTNGGATACTNANSTSKRGQIASSGPKGSLIKSNSGAGGQLKSVVINTAHEVQVGDKLTSQYNITVNIDNSSLKLTDGAILAIIKGLLHFGNDQASSITPAAFEKDFRRSVDNLFHRKHTFEEIAGCSLAEFIKRNFQWFQVKKRKGKILQISMKMVDAKEKDRIDEELDAVLRSRATSRPCVPPSPSRLSSKPVATNTNTTIGDRPSSERERSEAPTLNLGSLASQLLQMKPTDTLIFIEDAKESFENPFQFSLDVVSLWNTPNRRNAHIMYGVSARDQNAVTGLKAEHADENFQALFTTEFFTFRPDFKFHTVTLSLHKIGIIIIPGPSENPIYAPSVCRKDCPNNSGIKAGELLYRSDSKIKSCTADTKEFASIYEMFMKSYTSFNTAKVEKRAERDLPVSEDAEKFMKLVDNFKSGHYILIIGGNFSNTEGIKALSLVPWVYVFDFDTDGRVNDICKESIRKKRNHLVSNWQVVNNSPSEDTLQWCFVRGQEALKETLAKETDVRSWYRKVKDGVQSHCKELGKFASAFTVMKIVVLWSTDETCLPHLTKLLQQLEDNLVEPEITICLQSKPVTDNGKEEMSQINKNFTVSGLIYGNLNAILSRMMLFHAEKETLSEDTYVLPGGHDVGQKWTPITDKDAAWLNEDVTVLYRDKLFNQPVLSTTDLKNERDTFLKGGNLQWAAWYQGDVGCFDVKRDITDKLLENLSERIKIEKSGIVTLHHAPGSGGTTLAQRIIFSLRGTTPCMQLKPGRALDELAQRLRFIYSRTQSPILLLVEGEDENFMHYLETMTSGIKMIFLYVRRYPYSINELNAKLDFWLTGKVSVKEAKLFAIKYEPQCDSEAKKKQVLKLSQDVERKLCHYVFEFGLTAYDHKFQGLEKFVRGHLLLDKNEKDLLPWQRAIGYYALTYYYGQVSLPLQFFALLLGKGKMLVHLNDMNSGAQLLVEDRNAQPSKMYRICHYAVAKEILEQLLPHPVDKSPESFGANHHQLTDIARRQLGAFAKEFIEECGRIRKTNISNKIHKVLVATFISRDNHDVGVDGKELYREPSSAQTRRRTMFAHIIEDIPSSRPFEERYSVLRKLADTFPEEPRFIAHLGRFYVKCRPHQVEQAKKCFDHALELCQTLKNCVKKVKEDDEQVRGHLVHIHHMYGMMYQTQIGRVTGTRPDENRLDRSESPKKTLESRNKTLEDLLKLVNDATFHFSESCQNMPVMINDFPLVSEMKVRLQISNYICKNFEGGIQGYLENGKLDAGKWFLKGTYSRIDEIILECYDKLDSNHMSSEFHTMVNWYNALFWDPKEALCHWSADDTPQNRRFMIAVIKLKYFKGVNRAVTINNIDKVADIDRVVRLYEQNFEDMLKHPEEMKKLHCEHDYKEWLNSVRHPNFSSSYTVEDVLSRIRVWDTERNSPMSNFYVFVLASLLGIGTTKHGGDNQLLSEALTVIDKVRTRARNIRKPRYPREWLGRSDFEGIRRLIPGNRLGDLDHLSRDSRQPRSLMQTDLTICQGRIFPPNKNKLAGIISMSLHLSCPFSVKVFFVPITTQEQLMGSRYASQNVDFYLGFSLEHGYEAFHVQAVETRECPNCSTTYEESKKVLKANCKTCNFSLPQQAPSNKE